MANLLLTERCVRSCPYCFAKKQMDGPSQDGVLSWEDFMYTVDFFNLAGHRHLSLLGGEPTLHPDFTGFLQYLFLRGFDATVFTSAIVSRELLAHLMDFLAGKNPATARLNFVCNVNHPSISPEAEIRRQEDFFDKAGPYCMLSFNIFEADFDLGFAVDYITRYRLKKHIRIGLTHPILGEENRFIDASQMKEVALRLVSHATLLHKEGITLGIDCGFPMCMFDDEGLGKLYKISRQPLRFSCESAIDIGTNLDVWPCFPLSGYEKRSLYDFASLGELTDYYSSMMRRVRNELHGIFDECGTCPHSASGICAGGCTSYVLRKKRAASI